MTLPDQAEIRRLILDDLDGGFTLMVTSYQPGIYSGALRITRHHDDAQEVAQDTFLRAYRALERYDADQVATLALRPWLWTIALNLCRNRVRRSRFTSPLPSEEIISVSDEVPFDEEGWNDRFAKLTVTQRTAVVLRHVVDLPIAEIAEITGRPTGTVKADISRGLDKLRTIIDGEDHR